MNSPIRGWRYAGLILGLAVAAWIVINFNSRLAELNRWSEQREIVQERYDIVKATAAALDAEVAYAQSDAAVEKWAYEQGHMARPGDYPVIPLAASPVPPTPTVQPAVIQPERSNPESWLTLLFGPKAP